MPETDGIQYGMPYDPERDGVKFKPQIHRPGQSFRMEGFRVTVNKQSPVRGTDWTPRNRSTTVKTTADVGATVIALNSVYYMAKYRLVYFDRGGANEEYHYITNIDVTNKTVTIQEGLTYQQSAGAKADLDLVTVSNTDGRTCNIDVVMVGQHSSLSGLDLQFAKVRASHTIGWGDDDRFDGIIRVPIYFSQGLPVYVNALLFCDECYEVEGDEEAIHDSQESASQVDPNYVLRIVFTSAEATPTEKKLRFKLGVWRVQ